MLPSNLLGTQIAVSWHALLVPGGEITLTRRLKLEKKISSVTYEENWSDNKLLPPGNFRGIITAKKELQLQVNNVETASSLKLK